MNLLYGLTEKQMKEIHKEVERDYCREDILHQIEDMNEDREIKIKLTEEELEYTVNSMVNGLQVYVPYNEYAMDAINDTLAEREENKKGTDIG